MTIKTPEQIADEITALRTGPSGGFSMPDRHEFAEMVAIAIKRDRENRRPILVSPKNGVRVWVETPADALERITEMLDDGYDLADLEREK